MSKAVLTWTRKGMSLGDDSRKYVRLSSMSSMRRTGPLVLRSQYHTCQLILTQNRDRIAQKVGSLTENRDIWESWSLQL